MKNLEEKMAGIQKKQELMSTANFIPKHPDNKRATPSTFLRSALFSGIQSKDRVFMKSQTLASQDGITIKFTGEQLNQEDLTLWNALVHLAKTEPLGTTCEFTSYDILKTIGSGTSGEERAILHKNIIRLTSGVVEVLVGEQKTFFGSLINFGVKDDKTGHYKINLGANLVKLFKQHSWIDFKQRSILRRKPLALHLHGYYSSHKQPYPIRIETIKKLSGSKSKDKAGFKRQVKKALDALIEIEFIESYEINGDLIDVTKK